MPATEPVPIRTEHCTSIYVGGSWTPSASPRMVPVVAAATEEPIAEVPSGAVADVERAVGAARAAAAGWAATSADERAQLLRSVADALEARTDEIAATIAVEVGMPVKLARAIQVGLPVASFRMAADLLAQATADERIGNSLVARDPVGVVAAITPWNYPLHQAACKVAPALAAGCPIVLKPSEVAPLSAYALAEAIDEVGLPGGVFNLVSGLGHLIGASLVGHPEVDMVSFTGSGAVGRVVGRQAADAHKRVTLELGGKSPSVVLPDADLERAVRHGVKSALLNSGQTCTALTRLIVDRPRLAEAERIAVSVAEGFTLGDPLRPDTTLGPLASATQRARVRELITAGQSEGARLLTGGAESPDDQPVGFFVRPTVFSDVTADMRIAQEEVFGPVVCLQAYDDVDEAVELANATRYGLAAAVWAGDDATAQAVARRIRAGQVDVNGGRFNLAAPFGGFKQSGLGRENGRFGIEEFLELQSLQLPA
jgi:aldehyde dehydrogenase (NAD+)